MCLELNDWIAVLAIGKDNTSAVLDLRDPRKTVEAEVRLYIGCFSFRFRV